MKAPSIALLASATSAAMMSVPARASSDHESQLITLVEACKTEAMKGHFRAVTTNSLAVSAHRKRMKQLCIESMNVRPETQAEWITQCRSESRVAAGPFRRGNLDRFHVLRHLRRCEELAAAVRSDSD